MATYVGKVIRLIDEFTLIINAGNFSVSVGDTVQVYETSEPILDLDGTNLGEFVLVKDELEVIQAEENYAICKKNKLITKTHSTPLALSPLLERSYTEKVPLPVNSMDCNPLPELNKTIYVGDNVRKI